MVMSEPKNVLETLTEDGAISHISELDPLPEIWDDDEWCMGTICPHHTVKDNGSKVCDLKYNKGLIKSAIQPNTCMYKRALRTVTDEGKYRCHICDRDLFTPEAWIKHIKEVHKSIHSNIRQCEECGKILPKPVYLKNHMKHKH